MNIESIFELILIAVSTIILIMCVALLVYMLMDEIEEHRENKRERARRKTLNDRIKKIK